MDSTEHVELLAPRIAAKMLGITPRTLARWADEGIVKARRIGPLNHRRYNRVDLEALIAAGSDQTTATAS